MQFELNMSIRDFAKKVKAMSCYFEGQILLDASQCPIRDAEATPKMPLCQALDPSVVGCENGETAKTSHQRVLMTIRVCLPPRSFFLFYPHSFRRRASVDTVQASPECLLLSVCHTVEVGGGQ